jgi:hypothetical protein
MIMIEADAYFLLELYQIIQQKIIVCLSGFTVRGFFITFKVFVYGRQGLAVSLRHRLQQPRAGLSLPRAAKGRLDYRTQA